MTRAATQLRDYQVEAIEHLLSNPQGGLFLDMGLGKTASALTAIYEFNRFGVGPTLVVGPVRVIETVWRQEAKIWEHTKDLTFSLIRGNADERTKALHATADVYLINPEHLVWLFDTLGPGPYKFDTLIIDESSMFKNVGTKRFRTIRHKVRNFSRRYILTGTPRPNHLLELWPQLFLIDEGKRLGSSFTRFKDKYFQQTDRFGYKYEPRKGAKEAIYKAISDVILRIENQKKAEAIFNVVDVPLSDDVMRIYREVEDSAFSRLDSTVSITAMNVVGAMIKCRQVANGVVYADDDGLTKAKIIHKEKLNATKSIIDETGSPVIVVYNFKHELELLKEELKDYSPVVLGDQKDSAKTVADWNSGKIQVLLLHPASGGHGLNLQGGGHTMIWFGLTFSYEQYAQTIARINRQGQEHTPVIHLLVAPGTVDVVLQKTLDAKEKGQDDLFKFLKEYRRGR